MKITAIETDLARTITVREYTTQFNLQVENTDMNTDIWTSLEPAEATKLGLALLGGNATPITDLPEAKSTGYWVSSGEHDRSIHSDPEEVLNHAKHILAIHAFLVKRNEEQEAAKVAEEAAVKAAAEAEKAKEAKRNKRREELVTEFRSCGWDSLTRPAKEAYDRIIDLEEAAKV